MRVANRSAAVNNDLTAWAGVRQEPTVPDVDVVLTPLTRPELGEIRIDATVFAVGRAEQPFAAYGNDISDGLSRRHARLFREAGFVYLADLQSRNGTTVNGVAVGQAPCQLRDGDEICFGAVLAYRVQLVARARLEGSPVVPLTLTLTPLSGDFGLDTIVITKFPFLVSKTDATFGQYNTSSSHRRALLYLSRRHAYMFETGGQAYIEDLGSSNGTFIDGRRVEQLAALHDGAELAFGGQYFAYRVSITPAAVLEPPYRGARAPLIGYEPPIEREPVAVLEPVAAREPVAVREPVAEREPVAVRQAVAERQSLVAREPRVPPGVEGARTRFMAAPTSFLDIFCAADEPRDDSAAAGSAVAVVAARDLVRRRPRGRVMLLLSEVSSLLVSGAPGPARHPAWKAAAVAGIVGALALSAYFWTAAERDLKSALARGEYARATLLAGRLLEKHPDDLVLKARATEAALKADVPAWLVKVEARDFDGAQGVLAGMAGLATRDADLRPLIDELQWLGSLERLVSGRDGPEAPIRIYADEDPIEHLIERWNDDTGEHQRALDRIASYVPQFGEWYGQALTHLRKLQSEAAVYLPVIERVKVNIATQLERDTPEVLPAMLKDTAEKYPGLGGLDVVRQDLARYLAIRSEARARQPGRLFALLQQAPIVTPPFAQSLQALTISGRLPSAPLLEQYDAATQAWKDGKSSEALAGLQGMTAGPFGGDAAAELERRRGVTARFAALQESRNAADYVDQLLAFRESLDADEDVYFVRTTAPDLERQRGTVIVRAQEAMNRARTFWEEYESDGAIDATQRIENPISDLFRSRAHLLAEASRSAQQGALIYAQVDATAAGQSALHDEIETEVRRQRNSLHDLGRVIEPELLRTKLTLLGDPGE